MTDAVAQPSHYTSHPSGIECIEITKHMGFNLGNAVKYIWRCDLKKDAIEDLRKARQYLDIEIEMREKAAGPAKVKKVKKDKAATPGTPQPFKSTAPASMVSAYTLATFPHVHDLHGTCIKNRNGSLCK